MQAREEGWDAWRPMSTCMTHLASSAGVRMKEAKMPEMAPAVKWRPTPQLEIV